MCEWHGQYLNSVTIIILWPECEAKYANNEQKVGKSSTEFCLHFYSSKVE